MLGIKIFQIKSLQAFKMMYVFFLTVFGFYFCVGGKGSIQTNSCSCFCLQLRDSALNISFQAGIFVSFCFRKAYKLPQWERICLLAA